MLTEEILTDLYGQKIKKIEESREGNILITLSNDQIILIEPIDYDGNLGARLTEEVNEDLVTQILRMASKGVHREIIDNYLNAHASREGWALALDSARDRGMYRLTDRRDGELRTYYQYDGDKLQ